MNTKETRKNIIRAGRKAVDELIKVAEEKIITHTDDDVSADRLKNAAATKKLCIMDAFEILQRIEEEEAIFLTCWNNIFTQMLKFFMSRLRRNFYLLAVFSAIV